MTITRRLAAILAADVAGYSRLIGSDEAGTLAQLRTIRAELIDPAIAAHNGRLVKTTGDGLLVEFGSLIAALHAATQIQTGMAEQNAAMPQDERIEFRMGLNVGDVVVEDGDIFGDGVNVAARLAAYMRRDDILKKGAYHASQGRCVGRDGRVTIEFDNDTIWLGGHAVTCIEGWLNV
jgi:class 3 adenylate cyclase